MNTPRELLDAELGLPLENFRLVAPTMIPVFDAAERVIAKLQRDLAATKRQRGSLAARLDSYADDDAKLRSDLADRDEQIAALRAEVERLKEYESQGWSGEDVDNLRTRAEAAEARAAELDRENAALRESVQGWMESNAKCGMAKERVEQERAELELAVKAFIDNPGHDTFDNLASYAEKGGAS